MHELLVIDSEGDQSHSWLLHRFPYGAVVLSEGHACSCSTISLLQQVAISSGSVVCLSSSVFSSLLLSSDLLLFNLGSLLIYYTHLRQVLFSALWFFPPVLYHLSLLFLFLFSCAVAGVVVVVVHGRSPISLPEVGFSPYRKADKHTHRERERRKDRLCLRPVSSACL